MAVEAQHPAAAGEPADAIELEQFLPYRLSRLTNTVSNAIAALYRDRFGLSIPDWRVIAVLARFADSSAQDLVTRTRMDKVAVSRSVARLVERGLVNRNTDDQDRRLSRLSLSEEGRAVYARIVPMARNCEAQLLAGLAPEQREALDALLETLQAAADELQDSNQ